MRRLKKGILFALTALLGIILSSPGYAGGPFGNPMNGKGGNDVSKAVLSSQSSIEWLQVRDGRDHGRDGRGGTCTLAPVIDVGSFGPENLWPPNGKTVGLTVSGKVNLQSGCTLLDLFYTVDDEYDSLSSKVQFSSWGGEFTAVIPVEASRLGDDIDGRRYTITIFAQNQIGTGTSEHLVSIVPHEKGKK